MSKTAAQLAKQVMRELIRIDAVEEPSAEDNDYVQELSESYHETLNTLKINVTWDHSEIPDKVFLPLANVLADVASRSFGVKVDKEDAAMRLRTLKAAAANPYLGTPVRAEFM